jgi:hypothetical protein
LVAGGSLAIREWRMYACFGVLKPQDVVVADQTRRIRRGVHPSKEGCIAQRLPPNEPDSSNSSLDRSEINQ